MAGAFMVIESWLNEKATNENRGTVFGLYMMVTYASIMAGQMIVAAGDVQARRRCSWSPASSSAWR